MPAPAVRPSLAPPRSVAGQPRHASSVAPAEQALFARHRAGDSQAREELVERYLPLARTLARRYQRSNEPLDDLIQEASIGLIKALDRFNPDRGFAFSTYAVPTIVGELKHHFRDRTWSVRVPRNIQDLSLKVNKSIDDLHEQLGRQPSVSEIAGAVGSTDENVLDAFQASGAYRALSFETPSGGGGEDGGGILADSIGVDEDGFGEAEARATLEGLLPAITGREREVLRLRFEEDMTQAQIGNVIGISQMQVSRLIRRSLGGLRLAADADQAASPGLAA